MYTDISIEEICRKILKDTVLDVFYLIMEEPDISKTMMAKRFQEHDDFNSKPTKYRGVIDNGVAMLEGALFIDNWKDGVSERYFLTQYGKASTEILAKILEQDPTILRGSKIAKKIILGEEE